MNSVLQKKLDELKNADKFECWYLVKQPTEFDKICYLVAFLKEYKSNNSQGSLQDFIDIKISELSESKPDVTISKNYRALRVAAFFGLIIMRSSKYEDALITETFELINNRCNGAFENKELYEDIIQTQIEKMYISSVVDEEYNGIRQNFRLYPVILLYKVLLELGRATDNYAISMAEYRYLVTTTTKFEHFLDTLLLIILLRDDVQANSKFEEFREKFDNRLIQALKQLPTLIISNDTIALNPEWVKEVSKKVFLFESKLNNFNSENYLEFLGSTKSLFDLAKFETENVEDYKQELEITSHDETNRIDNGTNILLYGVPGSGKSWTIEHEYCKKGTNVNRVIFHPDYAYSDFIGQILPNIDGEGLVSYKFTAGPFTNILREAYVHPQEEYILIIEEINRGNAPAIFGEVFQLLDRKKEYSDEDDDGYPIGTSEYGITHANIATFVYGNSKHKVRLPSNLSIIGTMNTSDQNVFTLDTAFQRRWEMRLIENNFEHVERILADAEILDTGVTWEVFCTQINKIIIGNNARMTSSEDKRLGVYFINMRDLKYDSLMGNLSDGEYDLLRTKEQTKNISDSEKRRLEEIRAAMKHNRKFPEKVIKYLWDDAFKFNREIVFETLMYKSLEQIIRTFLYSEKLDRLAMFKENIRSAFTNSEV